MKQWLVALVSCAVAVSAGACSVDDRKLQHGTGASAGDEGSPQAGESSSGSGGSRGGSANTGGDGGSGGSDGLVDGCADLDTDGTADCEATLVENATFTSDVSSWVAESDTDSSWAPRNALTDSPSGSIKLVSATTRGAASQCLSITGERLVIAYANAFIEAGGAQLLVEVSFFPQADCQGERDRFFETPPASEDGAWLTIHAGGLSKPSTQSVAIALVGARTQTSGELTVYFDNVLLETEELEQ